MLEGSLEDIAKSADADLTALQTRNYISNNFPDTFNYKGNRIENIPKIRNRIAELAKTLPDRAPGIEPPKRKSWLPMAKVEAPV